MTRGAWMLFTGLLPGLYANAQDTLELREFHIIDTMVLKLGSSYEQRFDSLNAPSSMPSLNITEVLQSKGGIAFKNYGPGLLSTSTFRGGDANHTQVMWSGMKLNSPMLGTMDLSTLPVTQFDGLSIMSGVSSSLYATGGMGSLIAIQQSADVRHESARLLVGGGSFGAFHSAAQFNLPIKLWGRPSAISFSADLQDVENNYPFVDITTNPWKTDVLQDASFTRSNVSVSIVNRITKKIEVEAIWWLSQTQRKIPSTINSPHSYSDQSDASQKAFVRMRKEGGKVEWTLRSMYEQNDNAYADKGLDIDNLNRYESFQNQFETSYSLTSWLRLFGRVGYDRIKAQSGNYEQAHVADQWSMLGVFRSSLFHGALQLDGGSRYENFMQNSRMLPFIGMRLRPFKEIPVQVTASAANTVRFPTLNELYWVPGGETTLQPETGSTIEAGVKSDVKRSRISLVGYHSRYRDRIRWLPQGAIFSPVNIDEALIRGVDLNAGYTIGTSGKKLDLDIAYHFADALGRNSGDAFQPLSYVPSHSMSLNSAMELAAFTLHFQYQWTAKRFITNDASAFMPAYHITSTGMSYAHEFSDDMQMNLSIWVNNLFDWQYQNMPWRPMPGRSIYFKIDLRWAKRS
ncbi:MAG: TonB-dependent receptor [Flavobacteriales bacterium]|nr:TonB-dependent receptor [Flavobacteriales bacterium]